MKQVLLNAQQISQKYNWPFFSVVSWINRLELSPESFEMGYGKNRLRGLYTEWQAEIINQKISAGVLKLKRQLDQEIANEKPE